VPELQSTTLESAPAQEAVRPPAARPDREVVIDVRNLSKKFCRSLMHSLHYAARDMAGELLLGRRASEQLRPHEFWALSDVSFQLKQGEALGLIGRNGSGKTTLLRLIAGLLRPDTGCVRTRGRVAPLIALGAGFNPVLTGRENIFVNMAILGLTTREIKARLDAVIDFAEIESAIDAPVRTYSSGMAARLGFACAIHTQPDMLLIDEVLAVGDMAFRAKCYRKLAQLRGLGTTFILVSHSPVSILSICDSAIYLSQGKVAFAGPVQEAMSKYEDDLSKVEGISHAEGLLDMPGRDSGTGLTIRTLSLLGADGQRAPILMSGEAATLNVTCSIKEPLADLALSVIVRDLTGGNEQVLVLESSQDGVLFDAEPGLTSFQLQLPACGLRPGMYSLKVYLQQRPHFNLLDCVESFVVRVQAAATMTKCLFYQPRSWRSL